MAPVTDLSAIDTMAAAPQAGTSGLWTLINSPAGAGWTSAVLAALLTGLLTVVAGMWIQHRRETHERRVLSSALAIEIEHIADWFNPNDHERLIQDGKVVAQRRDEAVRYASPRVGTAPPNAIYEANLSRLGLLAGETAELVIRFHTEFARFKADCNVVGQSALSQREFARNPGDRYFDLLVRLAYLQNSADRLAAALKH